MKRRISAEHLSLSLEGIIEVDGTYVGGYVKPENRAADRKDRRLAENQSGTRRCVLALRQRSGRTITAVTLTENAKAV
jgi:hypothetical protein